MPNPVDGEHSCRDYRMYRAGAVEAGCYGSQIWSRHGFTHLVTAVHATSPSIFPVVFQLGRSFMHVISAHAPTEVSDTGVRAEFWLLLTETNEKTADSDKDIVLVGTDANGRVGSVVSSGIGDTEPGREEQ